MVVILGWALWFPPTLPANSDPTADSAKVSSLLSQSKIQAIQLRRDAAELESFSRSKVTWEAHTAQTNVIKEHVNKMGTLLQQMHDARSEASPWQQDAIDQITPLLKELADNVESSIQHLNDHPNRVHFPAYKAYLRTHYDLAAVLSDMIAKHADYGKTKAKFAKLEAELETASD